MAVSKNKIHPNLNAMLDTIAYAEGTSTHGLTKNDGYDVIVTGVDGKEIFTDYSQHPFVGRKSKLINPKNSLYSNAAGRYQHMLLHWNHYKKLLNLPDFSPASQDTWAIHLIKERRALELISKGHFDEAIAQISNLWASLPGANYPGQKMRDLKTLRDYYVSKGGKLWESKLLSAVSLPQLSPSLEPLKLEVIKPEPKPQPKLPLNVPMKKPSVFQMLLDKVRMHK